MRSIEGWLAGRGFSLRKRIPDAELERWRILMDANDDGIFDANLVTGETFYSPRWKAILGYGPDELEPTLEMWRQRIHPEDRQLVEAALAQHLSSRQGPTKREYRLRHRDGSWRWIFARAQAVWDRHGRAVRLAGFASDITSRKTREEKLRASEKRYLELFENSPSANWIYRTTDLRIINVNDAAIEHYGWTREEFLRLNVSDIRLPGESDAIEAELRDCAAKGRRMKPIRHRKKNQSEIWVGVSSYEIEVDGCPARLIQANDITARIAAEEQVKQAHEELENLVRQRTAELEAKKAQWHGLVDSLPQFVWTTTPQGSCDYVSRQWEEYSGIAVAELLANGWRKTVHPEDRACIKTAWQNAFATGWRRDIEYRIRAKDGSYRWFMSRCRPVRAPDGALVQWLGTSTDIDDQKQSAERLEAAVAERTVALAEAAERAEQAARAKSEFLAVMSHEIRTPMNGVIGMAHLLADTPLAPEQRFYLNTIRSSGQALLAIINDVLDFSKIEAGKMQLEKAEFDLRNLLEESMGLVAASAAAKDLQLSTDVAADVPLRVTGDAGRLRQILLNLLSNAVKFTERGSVRLAVSCNARHDNVAVLRFSVRDTGIGISPEQQSGLFQAFTQADTSTTRRFGGTGLGLSIAKQLVELMDGTIGVSSQLGEGATFWFHVCLERAATDEVPAPRNVGVLQPVHGGQLRDLFAGRQARILLADDNVTNRQVGLGILKNLGLRADAVADGVAVLAALADVPYDLVLMDVRMPNMDGLETTRKIRSAEKGDARFRLPIIAMTAGAMQGDRESCLAAGMDDYVSKPVNPRDLADTLQKWLPNKTVAASDSPTLVDTVFDRAGLLARLMGDEALATRVLTGFLEDMPDQLQALAKFVEAGSAQGVEDLAHRIKGASANVGGEAMRAVAQEMELAGRAGDLAAAQVRLPGLGAQFARLREAIVSGVIV